MVDTERVLVILLPDGVQRTLIGEVIRRFERRGLKLVGIKMVTLDESGAEAFYSEAKDKPFFEDLVSFVTSSPIVPMVWEGKNAKDQARTHTGASDPARAAEGTIRGEFALDIEGTILEVTQYDGTERDHPYFFEETELNDYQRIDEPWLYGATAE